MINICVENIDPRSISTEPCYTLSIFCILILRIVPLTNSLSASYLSIIVCTSCLISQSETEINFSINIELVWPEAYVREGLHANPSIPTRHT